MPMILIIITFNYYTQPGPVGYEGSSLWRSATRRRTFISWAEWLCDSVSFLLHLCLSSALSCPSLLAFVSLFLLFFLSLASVNESKKLYILSRVGQWMNEVSWKLIVERSEMSCEGIHGTDCTDPSIPILCPPPPLFFHWYSSSGSLSSHFFTLALVTGPLLNCLALFLSFLLSLTPDMKHPFPPHEIWRGPSWIVYKFSSMHANGGRGTGSGFQAGCSELRVVVAATGLKKKPVNYDYLGLQPILKENSTSSPN